MIIDLFQACLDDMQMSLYTVLVMAQAQFLLRLGRRLEERGDLLLLFLQPFLNPFI